jgi:hypothetical protein
VFRRRSVNFSTQSPFFLQELRLMEVQMNSPGGHMYRLFVAVAAILFVSSAAVAAAKKLPGTDCTPFPADSWWQADVSKLPVHAKSSVWMKSMGSTGTLWPDFGPSFGVIPGPYGIPITIVKSPRTFQPVSFLYATESDRVKYPLGGDTKVEGWQWSSGDRHTIIVHADTCRLYETWATEKTASGWKAGAGATWSLKSNRLRPIYWTSADAAGLPILPGLLRKDEVAARNVGHAIRFTTPVTNNTFFWPARHKAGAVNNSNYPAFGARFRLKASWKIPASYSADTKVALNAMKKYGLVLADNGGPWHFQGTAENGWSQVMLDQLKKIPASAFEAVDTSSLMISRDSMQVKPQP